jgi:catechol 2,3-dioxygenase-like lactoylglutathione lyase family enzyme
VALLDYKVDTGHYGVGVGAMLEELTVADSPQAWWECGFAVEGEESVVGDTRIRFTPQDGARGLVRWSLRGAGSLDLDGLATVAGDRPTSGDAPPHSNGVTGLDHVVAISPDLDRTVTALVAAGLDLRRIREEPTPVGAPRQAFFRLGSTILEVVQEPPEATERLGGDRPAFFWGLAFLAPDLERTVAFLGDRAGEIRPAVQPGRQIATLRREAGLSVPVALMTPPSGERGDARAT